MNVVITQSMYFPWLGLMSQIALADVVVHLDDVAFTRGFFNRVQVKAHGETRWMTVPLQHVSRGTLIRDAKVDDSKPWREQHAGILTDALRVAPHFPEALQIFRSVVDQPHDSLATLSRSSILALATFFGLTGSEREFVDSTTFSIKKTGSERILEIAKSVGATRYISGLGGYAYLDHKAFEAAGIEVRYMQYRIGPYAQLHGPFTPFVTSLDAIANCGMRAKSLLSPHTINWREVPGES